jgi:hypothetical protein
MQNSYDSLKRGKTRAKSSEKIIPENVRKVKLKKLRPEERK